MKSQIVILLALACKQAWLLLKDGRFKISKTQIKGADIIDEFSQRIGISKNPNIKKQIIKPKKRENVESSAHTPYFPSYELGGYFIADNSKPNPTQKKQTSKNKH